MTYDLWKDPTDYSPDDDSDWLSLVEAFEQMLSQQKSYYPECTTKNWWAKATKAMEN